MSSYPSMHNDDTSSSTSSNAKVSSARLVPARTSNEAESSSANLSNPDIFAMPSEFEANAGRSGLLESALPKVLILKSGEMKKRPFQTWNFMSFLKVGFIRRRYFILFSNGQLDYYVCETDYSNAHSEKRKGSVTLSKDACVHACDDKDCVKFDILDGSHDYTFVCSTPEDCRQWMRAFTSCISGLRTPPRSTQFAPTSNLTTSAILGKGLYSDSLTTASPSSRFPTSHITQSALQPQQQPPSARPSLAPMKRSLSIVLIAASTSAAIERPAGKRTASPPILLAAGADQAETLISTFFEFPRHATTIDKLVTLSGLGDLQGVMQIMLESPQIASIPGKVFKFNEETGDWFVEKLAYAIPMALNNEHHEVAKFLLQCDKKKKSEQEDMFTSLSRFPGSGIHSKSCMLSSFGFQPTRLDQLFRASIAVRQSTQEVPTWLGRPMTKLDEKYADILVDRRGKDLSTSGSKVDAFMITDGIIMEVEKQITYCMAINALTGMPELQKKKASSEKGVKPRTQVPFGIHPRYLEVSYEWNSENTYEDENESNIFGKNSLLIVDADILTVPVCETTPENLAFFGAELITPNDIFEFEIPSGITHVPLTAMRVGKDYVNGFIMQETNDGSGHAGGGGAYLEWHDTPHLHMPLNGKTSGALVLGKMEDGKMLLGAFEIEFGTAVYMHPYTLHNDCFLVGKFGCVYSATENFQTGTVLESETMKPAAFQFV